MAGDHVARQGDLADRVRDGLSATGDGVAEVRVDLPDRDTCGVGHRLRSVRDLPGGRARVRDQVRDALRRRKLGRLRPNV